MITAIDDQGKIRLSRQAVLEGWSPEEALEHDRGGKSGGSSRPRGGHSGGGYGGHGGDRGGYGGSHGSSDRGGRH
jgi:polyribonucleotide nucleotidyltransferase